MSRFRPLLAAVVGLAFAVAIPARAEAPKLIVLVSVDQFCQEYLLRYRDNILGAKLFFAAMEEKGAVYRNCHHQHGITLTAPGHAALMTGAYPNVHGIVGNNWYDRLLKKDVYCVTDQDAKNLGPELPEDTNEPEASIGMSPRSMLAETVGDVLKLATAGRSKVFGVGWKDRSGILMAGHTADAVYWNRKGNWITSTYYRNDIPGYLRNLNEGKFIKSYSAKPWKLLHAANKYHQGAEDDNPAERPPEGFTRTFPHEMPDISEKAFYAKLPYTPFANEFTLQAAREIITAEKLGADAWPDILCVGLSANDYVGHAYGPHSLEVEDMVYRTDQQLAQFTQFLADTLGTTGWTIILTADHAVAPVPKYAQDNRIPAIRNPVGVAANVKPQLEMYLRKELDIPTDGEEPLVTKVEANQVYLQHGHPALKGEKYYLALKLTRDWFLENRTVVAALTREQLMTAGETKLLQQMHKAFHPRRSGDVLFVTMPYSQPGASGTTHGSPWNYDSHVPLMMFGHGIRAGKHDRQISPAAIAATVARLIGIDPPSAHAEGPANEALQRD